MSRGRITREAPAQAELRPTCAEASHFAYDTAVLAQLAPSTYLAGKRIPVVKKPEDEDEMGSE
jgi:hypothetical protein